LPKSSSTNALGYFDSPGEDSSSQKGRRNSSSPEEIAELARGIRVEEEEAAEQKELAELDRFRDMDLKPIETVMEGGTAGDLIMCGTPVKARDESLFSQSSSVIVGSKIEDWVHAQRPQSGTPSSSHPTPFVEQDVENQDVKESDNASDPEQQQLIIPARHPTFITVIGMLPATMFWATAAPLVECSNQAFDILIEKLTGLKL
jgi:hypothetical protein